MNAQAIATEEYRALIAAVDRYLANFHDDLTPEDREEIRQEAFVGLALQRSREPVTNSEAFLIKCARNTARMRLRSHDHNRREPFDPLDSETIYIPDSAAGPDELAIQADEDRRVRALIEQLSETERAVLKLRLDQELPPKEIADHLGLSISRAHKRLKRAGHALAEAIAASELGEFSRRQRSLLAAIVMGIAKRAPTPGRRAAAPGPPRTRDPRRAARTRPKDRRGPAASRPGGRRRAQLRPALRARRPPQGPTRGGHRNRKATRNGRLRADGGPDPARRGAAGHRCRHLRQLPRARRRRLLRGGGPAESARRAARSPRASHTQAQAQAQATGEGPRAGRDPFRRREPTPRSAAHASERAETH